MNSETAAPAAEFAFSIRLTSTPRGARLARRLAVEQLAVWGLPATGAVAAAVESVAGELAANAITHGRLPGRDFELCLRLLAGAIRIEVSDARPEAVPVRAPVAGDAERGRGLLLVDAYANRWGCDPRGTHTKTVWAEVPR